MPRAAETAAETPADNGLRQLLEEAKNPRPAPVQQLRPLRSNQPCRASPAAHSSPEEVREGQRAVAVAQPPAKKKALRQRAARRGVQPRTPRVRAHLECAAPRPSPSIPPAQREVQDPRGVGLQHGGRQQPVYHGPPAVPAGSQSAPPRAAPLRLGTAAGHRSGTYAEMKRRRLSSDSDAEARPRRAPAAHAPAAQLRVSPQLPERAAARRAGFTAPQFTALRGGSATAAGSGAAPAA
eukprot:TRINITY_DN4126_c0_g1_i12.p1 TRINITY_DN4126_c0_g1~~TRINITY_DN4126_c0_g1_i12.p1  ORF type:complete len:238 (+),score=15.90 TRINITY_DN4126_c0_g1_i12:122-835(+)